MPFYEYQCTLCYSEIELLQSIEEGEYFVYENTCECGGDLKKMISTFAHTPSRWGDETGKYGVNGMFSKGLGKIVKNRREEEKIMASMGKVPVADLPQHFIEDRMEQLKEEEAKIETKRMTYISKVKEYGSDIKGKIKAITETLPANEMLKEASNAS